MRVPDHSDQGFPANAITRRKPITRSGEAAGLRPVSPGRQGSGPMAALLVAAQPIEALPMEVLLITETDARPHQVAK